MSVTNLTDYQRDIARDMRRRLEALWALDSDRVALGRLQNAFGATTRPATTEAQSPSVLTSVARPTDQGDNP